MESCCLLLSDEILDIWTWLLFSGVWREQETVHLLLQRAALASEKEVRRVQGMICRKGMFCEGWNNSLSNSSSSISKNDCEIFSPCRNHLFNHEDVSRGLLLMWHNPKCERGGGHLVEGPGASWTFNIREMSYFLVNIYSCSLTKQKYVLEISQLIKGIFFHRKIIESLLEPFYFLHIFASTSFSSKF